MAENTKSFSPLPNPLANAVGSAFKVDPESDHFGHVCCCHLIPSHPQLPPVLLAQLPPGSPSGPLESISPRVYSQHTGQRDPFKTCHCSAQNLHDVIPPLKILQWHPISLRVNVQVLKMTFRALWDLTSVWTYLLSPFPPSFSSSHTDLFAVL